MSPPKTRNGKIISALGRGINFGAFRLCFRIFLDFLNHRIRKSSRNRVIGRQKVVERLADKPLSDIGSETDYRINDGKRQGCGSGVNLHISEQKLQDLYRNLPPDGKAVIDGMVNGYVPPK